MIKIENVVREPNVVELKPWKSIHDTIKEPMVTGLGPMETGSALAMGFARITEPDILGYPPHKHPFDQWVYLIGDSNNFADFDAEVEFTYGDEILKIDYACYIFIPKGVMHCPLDIKRVGKPFIFIDASITEEASGHRTEKEEKKKSGRPKYVALKNEEKE